MEKEEITKKSEMWAISKYDLEKLLREYDDFYESYPEHCLEGLSVWKFINKKINGEKPEYIFDSASDEWSTEPKYKVI